MNYITATSDSRFDFVGTETGVYVVKVWNSQGWFVRQITFQDMKSVDAWLSGNDSLMDESYGGLVLVFGPNGEIVEG